MFFFFFQAEDGIRDRDVTGVQTCALPISIAVEDVLDRFADGPAAVFGLGVELVGGQTEQRGDELGARRVVVGEQGRQVLVAPARQELELVADAPDLPGVLLLVEDVVYQQIARGPAPGAAVAAGLLEIVLRQVVENLERLVERILKTSNDRLHVSGLRREIRHASPPRARRDTATAERHADGQTIPEGVKARKRRDGRTILCCRPRPAPIEAWTPPVARWSTATPECSLSRRRPATCGRAGRGLRALDRPPGNRAALGRGRFRDTRRS